MPQISNVFGSERFWQRFDAKVVLIPFSTCHYWAGDIDSHGYGLVKVNGRRERAHRVAYGRRRNRPLPSATTTGIIVRHRCDNPACVNPDHLVLGTQADNMDDAAARKRMPLGLRHHNGKLSEADVLAILAACARGERTGDLARQYGVTPSRISTLKHGRVGRNNPAYAEAA